VGNEAQSLRLVAFARKWFPGSIFTSDVRRGMNGARLFPEKTLFAKLAWAEQKVKMP
jgi:hypothetical protein